MTGVSSLTHAGNAVIQELLTGADCDTAVGGVTVDANMGAVSDGNGAANNIISTTTGNISVSSPNGNISLLAGDNVTLQDGTVISAPTGSITVTGDSGDSGDNDSGGANITVASQFVSGSGIALLGGNDNGDFLATNLATGLGQSSHVTVYTLVTDGTLDLRFEDILNSRMIVISGIDIRPPFAKPYSCVDTNETGSVGKEQ